MLAGPLSFGITGPTLVLTEVAGHLAGHRLRAGHRGGQPADGVLLARRGTRFALAACAALQAVGSAGMTVVAMSLARSPVAMGVVTSSLASVGALAPLLGSQLSAATSTHLHNGVHG